MFLFISEYVTIDKPPDKFASRVCGSVNTNSTVEMSCPNNTWFYVIGKMSSSDNFSNCSSSGFPTTNFLLSASSSAPPLVPVCRGRQSFERDTQLCNETIQVSSKINKSAGVEFFEVTYKCISGKYMLQTEKCADSYSASVPPPIPVLPQWHVKDPDHSAKSACGGLHLSTHTPLT